MIPIVFGGTALFGVSVGLLAVPFFLVASAILGALFWVPALALNLLHDISRQYVREWRMKHLTLVILLTVAAPLSWGEDVWYCVDNYWAGLDYKSSEQKWVQNNITPSGFVLKYD
jgi:hypothetical protein